MGRWTSADAKASVSGLTPHDDQEAEHQYDALAWLDATDDIFRRVPPKTPPKHLVAYFLLWDRASGSVLLVHHRKAKLWLPTGGHVEVGEDPAETVRRETLEELGVPAVFADSDTRPLFVTVTETNGSPDSQHVDVSLWYLLLGACSDFLQPDEREFIAARWWTRAELDAADPTLFEPHLGRFLAKIDASR